MARKQMPLNQLEMPVPRQPVGILAKAKLTARDKDELYERHMGGEATQRQQEALRESRRCTCAEGYVLDPKTKKLRFVVNWRLHAVGCRYVPVGGKR